jgi:type IV secretory pathway TrbD component
MRERLTAGDAPSREELREMQAAPHEVRPCLRCGPSAMDRCKQMASELLHTAEPFLELQHRLGVCRACVIVNLRLRFWAYVNKDGPVAERLGTKCWIWTKSKSKYGYGGWRWKPASGPKPSHLAHRTSWEFVKGDRLPSSVMLMHECDNPPCVNPAHLTPGTSRSNMHTKFLRGRDRTTKVASGDVPRIHELRAQGWTHGRIAQEFGVTAWTIMHILSRGRQMDVVRAGGRMVSVSLDAALIARLETLRARLDAEPAGDSIDVTSMGAVVRAAIVAGLDALKVEVGG